MGTAGHFSTDAQADVFVSWQWLVRGGVHFSFEEKISVLCCQLHCPSCGHFILVAVTVSHSARSRKANGLGLLYYFTFNKVELSTVLLKQYTGIWHKRSWINAFCVISSRCKITSKLKKTLKGPSQPHLCFCLHARIWLLHFIRSLSKRREMTVKLFKIIKHTFMNTAYRKTIRICFIML